MEDGQSCHQMTRVKLSFILRCTRPAFLISIVQQPLHNVPKCPPRATRCYFPPHIQDVHFRTTAYLIQPQPTSPTISIDSSTFYTSSLSILIIDHTLTPTLLNRITLFTTWLVNCASTPTSH